jgi:hypothetical protein
MPEEQVRAALSEDGRLAKDQLWFHHPELQERVARAENDFALGRAARTKGPEQAQAFLDSLKKAPTSNR